MSFARIDLEQQPDVVRLQLLLARTAPSDAERVRIAELTTQLADWPEFLDVALRKFNAPLVRHNLKDIHDGVVPEGIWRRIHEETTATAFRNMMMLSAQKRLQDDVLLPSGIEGLFFKGVSIAAQYYPDISLRPCRDVDVLVPKAALRELIRKALSQGYMPVTSDGRVTPLTSDRDLDALERYGDSVTIVSPDRVVFDLQTRLDKYSGIFSGYDVFTNSDSYEIGGMRFATLPTDFLLNYLCHHHTRHTWSRLNWLSDLDALCRSDRFDRDAVLSLADVLGQRGTIEASLELRELMGSDHLWDGSGRMWRGKVFLSLCIQNLPGNLGLEKRMSLSMKGGEFMFSWQAKPELIRRARRGWWRGIFRPTVAQYARMPLPRMLNWIYYVMRFFQLIYLIQQRRWPAQKP